MSTRVLAPKKKSGRKARSFSIKIRPDLVELIDNLAVQRQVQAELLVNNILEKHLTPQVSDTEFLFSLGGMFRAELSATSENVRTTVDGHLLQKYHRSEI